MQGGVGQLEDDEEKWPTASSQQVTELIEQGKLQVLGHKGTATCHGLLGFQDKGRLIRRYAILYPGRLSAWDRLEDVLNMHGPKFTIKLDLVYSVESLLSGFILRVKDPLSRKIGVHVSKPEDLYLWITRINRAKLHGEDFSPHRSWCSSPRVSNAGKPEALDSLSSRLSLSLPNSSILSSKGGSMR